jgi:hypothetical protein
MRLEKFDNDFVPALQSVLVCVVLETVGTKEGGNNRLMLILCDEGYDMYFF